MNSVLGFPFIFRGRLMSGSGDQRGNEARRRFDQKLVTGIVNRARKEPKRVVFAEADTYNVLKAAQIVRDQ